IICADGRNRIVSWNPAAEKIFGHSAEQALGQPLDIIVPPHMRAAHSSGLERVAHGGAPRIIGASLTLSGRRRDGTEFPIDLSLSQWRENGEPRFGAIIRDVTRRKQIEDELRRAAEFDHLTGLANRASLLGQLEQTCEADDQATVVLINLDSFAEVNDALGHSNGDRVLKIVADRLRGVLDPGNTLARLGGDEFVAFVPGTSDPLAASALAERLIEAVEPPIEFDGQSLQVSASVGIAVRTLAKCGAEELLNNAHLALFRAKSEGLKIIHAFTPELRARAAARRAVDAGLRKAWEHREFELYYQPQVLLAGAALTGAETLIRWNHPEQGLVSPGAFLPVLESGLLAAPIGEWILRTACQQAARWRQLGLDRFRIGVNLFAAQFKASDLAATVERALADAGLPPEALELEITENIILRQEQSIIRPLERLRSLGVGIAFDDFGTGFASLSMLKNYPVTKLKIDRSFVSGADITRKDQAVVEAVAGLGRAFDLGVIAEGIETAGQAALMRSLGCEEGQGYLFGKPMPASAFEERFCRGGPRFESVA
ncbi:MAG: EAL domain-containing protein, partial [Hansschlegelia sp.]